MATKPVKLPSGAWRVRVEVPDSPDGKRHYKSFTNADKKMAVHLAAQYEALQKEQHDPANMTVGAALDDYINSRTAVLSPTTIREYRRIRKIYISDLESLKLRALTNQRLQQSMNRLAAGHSPKTVRNVYALLTAVLRAYHPDFAPRINLPKRVHTEIQIPKKSSVSDLLKAAEGTPMENAILLAAAYGLRRGEISALTYSDLDREALTISITKSLAKNDKLEWVLKAPKSYAGTRTISISAGMADRLLRNRHSVTNIVPINPDMITRRFGILCKKVGVSCRFHDLRHYNASIMLALDVPDKYAMERLGQSTPGLIKAVYQHIIDDKRQQVNAIMDAEADAFLVK